MATTSEQLMRWQEKQAIDQTFYGTKTIEFMGRHTPIVLQNENGPCPLLAICNILLLRDEIDLKLDATYVPEGKLLTLVAESLVEALNDDNQVEAVADAIDLLPSLTTGMDVNVKFTKIDDFVLTKESSAFGLLGIPLYHGWLVDPQDSETSNAISSQSFDSLMAELVNHQYNRLEAGDGVEVEHLEKEDTEDEHEPLMGFKVTKTVKPTSASSDGVKSSSSIRYHGDWVDFKPDPKEHVGTSSEAGKGRREGESSTIAKSGSVASTLAINDEARTTITARQAKLIKDFLENNASQLTVYGLFCLQEGLEENQLCVLFRNNHFNTLLKYQGEMYILVTDLGYMFQPGVVWEKLNEVKGNTVFVNRNFMISKPGHEIEEVPEDKSVPKKPDGESILKGFEDYLEGLDNRAAPSSPISSTDHIGKILEKLALEEEQVRGDLPVPFPFPSGFIFGREARNPSPEPERNYSVFRRNRIPSKKISNVTKLMKDKCSLM